MISISCFAQKIADLDVTDITKLTLVNPGVSFEKKVGKYQTFYGEAYMNISATIGYSSSLGATSVFHLDPAFTLQYRYYYNAVRRQEKGKKTEMNSLNYISPAWQVIFPKNSESALQTLSVNWGLQRNYNSRFSIDYSLGLGYVFTKTMGEFTTVSRLSLGLWLNRRQ